MMKQTLEENNINIIQKELDQLGCHIKTYSVGAYPVFYLQLHSVLRVQDVLEMRFIDIYSCEAGNVRVRSKILWEDRIIELSDHDRREFAWYAMQRMKVRGVKEEELQETYLCVNKQGRQLQKQVYRKMLERASNELDLSRIYNSCYLRSLYGYLQIAHGHKTVDDVAREYRVERYYLLNRIFKGTEIEYDIRLLDEIASICGEGVEC